MKTSIKNTGLSIFIILFTAVCLFTFAGIVLASASQNERQTAMLLEKQENYYAACCRAYNSINASRGSDGGYEETFVVDENTILCIAYEIIGDTYKITTWQTENVSAWRPDENANLIK